MSNGPGDNNPFEGMFGPGGFDMNALLGQLQSMMQPYDGILNWDAAIDMARRASSVEGSDPSVSARDADRIADALRLADHWLDDTTTFPSGVRTPAAWSRADWLLQTLDTWKSLVEPVVESSTKTLQGNIPPEMAAMVGPMVGFLGKAVGAMYATQAGQGLGALAGEVLASSDIGIPLAPAGQAALLPTNIAAFAAGLGVDIEDVTLYLALREAAHQRLFAGVPWLREHVLEAVRAHAAGVEINIEAIQQRVQEQLGGLNPADPAAMQELLSSGLFDIPQSPAQKAALERLEVVLALIEGWVDEVVGQATTSRMPVAAPLQEAVRRRRAAGGPAEQTFATLVGLEMRPRRLRDASTLWGSLRSRQGIEARDGVWMSPALLPTSADLDDPLGFREGASQPTSLTDEAFDAELQKLLEAPDA